MNSGQTIWNTEGKWKEFRNLSKFKRKFWSYKWGMELLEEGLRWFDFQDGR